MRSGLLHNVANRVLICLSIRNFCLSVRNTSINNLRLRSRDVITISSKDTRSDFAKRVALIRGVRNGLRRTITANEVCGHNVRFTNGRFLRSMIFTKRNICTSGPRFLLPPLTNDNDVNSNHRAIVLHVRRISVQGTTRRNVRFLSNLRLRPNAIFGNRRPSAKVDKCDLRGSLVAICNEYKTRRA